MKLIEYLGLALKSGEMIELIATYDMEILYHIDILHENTPDRYSARSARLPVEFAFDQDQVLCTIFCDMAPEIGAASAGQLPIGAPLYQTIEEARIGAQDLGASFEMRENVVIPILKKHVSWAKLSFDEHSRHYEYSAGGLRRLTLSRITPA